MKRALLLAVLLACASPASAFQFEFSGGIVLPERGIEGALAFAGFDSMRVWFVWTRGHWRPIGGRKLAIIRQGEWK